MNSFMRQSSTTPTTTTTATSSPSSITTEQMHSFLKDKQAWENAISMYQGPDPLDHWYNYISWYENHKHNDPESRFRETLERCLTAYEYNEYYKQDNRMVRLWLKYITMQSNPLHFFQVLHHRNVGKQDAIFYIAWAAYYESINLVKEAESVFNLAFQEKAQPYADLHHAHSKLVYAKTSLATQAVQQQQQQKLAATQQQYQQQYQQQQQQVQQSHSQIQHLNHHQHEHQNVHNMQQQQQQVFHEQQTQQHLHQTREQLHGTYLKAHHPPFNAHHHQIHHHHHHSLYHQQQGMVTPTVTPSPTPSSFHFHNHHHQLNQNQNQNQNHNHNHNHPQQSIQNHPHSHVTQVDGAASSRANYIPQVATVQGTTKTTTATTTTDANGHRQEVSNSPTQQRLSSSQHHHHHHQHQHQHQHQNNNQQQQQNQSTSTTSRSTTQSQSSSSRTTDTQQLPALRLPRKFSAYSRNHHETWKPALFLEEPADPSRNCHYAKDKVYPGTGMEYSAEELRANKLLARFNNFTSEQEAATSNYIQNRVHQQQQVQHRQTHESNGATTLHNHHQQSSYSDQNYQNGASNPVQQEHQLYYIDSTGQQVIVDNNGGGGGDGDGVGDGDGGYDPHLTNASEEDETTKQNNQKLPEEDILVNGDETVEEEEDEDEEVEDGYEEQEEDESVDDEDEVRQLQENEQQQQQQQLQYQQQEQQQQSSSQNAQIEASTIRFEQNKTIKIKFKKERTHGGDTLKGSNYSAYTIENIYHQQEISSPNSMTNFSSYERRNGGGHNFHPYLLSHTSTPKTSSKRHKTKLKRVDSNSSSAENFNTNGRLLKNDASTNPPEILSGSATSNGCENAIQNATFNDNANYSFSSAVALDNSNCSLTSAVDRLNFRDASSLAAGGLNVTLNNNHNNNNSTATTLTTTAVADFSTYQENSYFATQHDTEAKARRLTKALETIERHFAKESIDPFNSELCRAFLTQLDFPGIADESHANYKIIQTPLPKIANTKVLNLPEGIYFNIDKEVGRGSYGSVYKATDGNTGKVVALKYQKPPNSWEIYICDQVLKRIKSKNILPGLMDISTAIIAPNASLIATEFSPFGSLLDINNKIRQATTKVMHESMVMHFSAQICNIIYHLHKQKIIHADIKPDNFLLMRIPTTDTTTPSLRLIDFGCAIDMTLFPDTEKTKFRKIIQTDGFTCVEMQERRPWSYETDLFCIAGTIHVMLFGEYMQLQKQRTGNWDIKQKLPRYLKKNIWMKFFSGMLNLKTDKLPNLLELSEIFDLEAHRMDSELQKQIRTLSNILYKR